MFPGALEPISDESLAPAELETSIRSALDGFGATPELPRDWRNPSLRELSPRAYQQVSITLADDGSLELDPLQRGTRGGFVGSLPAGRLRVPADAPSEEFLRSLAEAFELAG